MLDDLIAWIASLDAVISSLSSVSFILSVVICFSSRSACSCWYLLSFVVCNLL